MCVDVTRGHVTRSATVFRKAHDLAEEKANKFKEAQAAAAAGSGETEGKCGEGKCVKSDDKKKTECVKEGKKKK